MSTNKLSNDFSLKPHCAEDIFDKIFKNKDYINAALQNGARPALVGKSTAYLALITLDWSGDLFLKCPKPRFQWLRDCLRDHDYEPRTCEATIKESAITFQPSNVL